MRWQFSEDKKNTSLDEKISKETQTDVQIKLKRQGKDIHSPEYSLTIYGDGTVVYKGIKNVKILGEQTSRISESELNKLVNKFIDIYYFALKDKYDKPNNKLNNSTLPIVTTALTLEGKNKAVYHDRGSQEHQPLTELEDKIDAITNSKQWTGIQ
jgi:Domain of unknown function (DUF6438)